MENTSPASRVAILSGFGLIIAAFVLALIYGWLCRVPDEGSQGKDAKPYDLRIQPGSGARVRRDCGRDIGHEFLFRKTSQIRERVFRGGGGIPWFVNGMAFAGDYLSAASFLGICGMIAFYGYDGFLYSIGYLAGWVVALFVIAEPLND